MNKITLTEVKRLAQEQGVKFSTAEYTLLGYVEVSSLPYATQGSKPNSWIFQCDGFRMLLKSGTNLNNLAGKIEICRVVIKEVEYKFLVVS